MLYAKEVSINHIWYLGYQMNPDKSVTILLHDRKHIYRDTDHPQTENHYHLIETEGRIVTDVNLNGADHIVTNPQHIFSYPTF